MSRWTQYMTAYGVWLIVSRTASSDWSALASFLVAVGFLVAAGVELFSKEGRPHD